MATKGDTDISKNILAFGTKRTYIINQGTGFWWIRVVEYQVGTAQTVLNAGSFF